jgi:hypothetical protein
MEISSNFWRLFWGKGHVQSPTAATFTHMVKSTPALHSASNIGKMDDDKELPKVLMSISPSWLPTVMRG